MAQPLRRQPSRPMARPGRGRPVLRRVFLALTALVILLVLVLLAGGFWVYDQMRASLPRLDGERRMAGLAAPGEVERDDLGVAGVRAANRLEAAPALGVLPPEGPLFPVGPLR